MKRHTKSSLARLRGFALPDTIRPPALSRRAGRRLALLLAALMLISIAPYAAAEGDNVLESLYHAQAGEGVIDGRDVIFTVPHRFAGTEIDFTSGLSPKYAGGYKNIVLYPSGSAAIGDESSYAELRITYHRSEDSSSDSKRVVTYNLYVRRADPVAATFAGTADVSVPTGTTRPVPALPIRALYKQNDGAPFTHVAIYGSNPIFGTLLLDGSPYVFGQPIPLEVLDAERLTFAATDTGVVSFDVQAFAGGDTSTPIGSGATLTVSSYTAPYTTGTIQLDVTKERLFTFRLEDFASRSELYNIPIEYVIITPQKTSAGTWLFKGSAMRTGYATTIPANEVQFLEFNATVSGAANFTWQVQTAGGKTAAAAGAITVHSIPLELEDYISPDSLGKGGVHSVSSSHLRYRVTSELQGVATPTYMKISQIPPTKDGYLYLAESLPKAEDGSYPAINAETALKVGAIIPFSYVNQLRIASNSTSTSDSITFSWTLTADRVIKTADWAAPALYTVPFSEGQDLLYATDTGVPVTLRVDDFRTALYAATGATLSYVTFTLPSKEQGTLYHSYNILKKAGTAVTTSTKYYYGRTPSLAQITFVPAADYYGTCVFTYTAFSDSGVRVSGKVTVTVTRNAAGTVVLVADKNAPLDLDAEVFRSAFKTATGKELESIQFTNTSANAALYTGYIGPGQYGSVVSTGTRLYLYASPLLSRTTFVPKTGFTGSVTYSYYARSVTSEGFYGKLVVFVVESEGGNVCYSVNTNGYVRLNAADFSSAFTAATGSLLSSVTFTLPAKTAGTLYESYSPATGKGTAVKSSTKYTVSDSPSISDIYFVPAANAAGTFDVAFTATSQTGASYTGKLKFLVGRGDAFGRTYIRLSANAQPGAPMAINPDMFRAAFLRATGQPLAGVRFTPPSSYDGRLCTGYVSPSSPGTLVSDTTRYLVSGSPALSGVVFVPAQNFGSGTVIIPFDAYAADGTAFAGHLTVYVGAAAPFDDIGGYPWAADSIAFLADIGVVLGSGGGKFNPNSPIKRGDFVLMVARAFELAGGSATFPDVHPGDYYYAAVVAAKSLGIIEGSGGYFRPNAALSRQDAMVILKKTADVLGITLPKGKGSLAQFPDAGQIADYALGAAEALVGAGVINGSNGKLNPRSSISRAEMAVVLYRVLILKSK